MSKRVIQRGNTVFFSFTFVDEDDAVATVDSAELQLTYPGFDGEFVTERLTLTEDDDVWEAEWDSSRAGPGWVEYHAHAIADTSQYAEDGRHRLTGNRANLDHDALPTSATASSSAMGTVPGSDYGQ